MRIIGIAIHFILATCLTGCCAFTQPYGFFASSNPPELPPWAYQRPHKMNPGKQRHVRVVLPSGVHPKMEGVQPKMESDRSARSTSGNAPTNGGSAPSPILNRPDEQPLLPFTPEWWAKETAIDDRLKRILIICQGC